MPSSVNLFLARFTTRLLISKCDVARLPRNNPSLKCHTRQASFKAAFLKVYEKPLEVEEVTKIPKLKKDQIRIGVHHCGVNSSDVLMCQGQPGQVQLQLPFVPGFEVAGDILEVAEGVTDFKIGDRVLALNKEVHGGFAEQCIAFTKDVWTIPPELGFEKAASLVDCYATAYLGLIRRAAIEKGSTVLVTAAAGGLGLAAVDLAANTYQTKVIGVCGTEDKASLVREKGAWAALSYHQKGMLKAVNEVTNGKGVSVVFDAVGGELFRDCLECVAHEGKVIVAGFASRQIPTIQTDLLLPRSVALIGISLSHYRVTDPELYREVVEEVIEMGANGDVDPHVSATYSLDQVNDALQFVLDRKSTGKVIVNMK